MNEKRKIRISKFLSLILRHKPETIGLTLDSNGWAEVESLLKACAKNGNAFSRDELEEVVATNEKKRFAFDETQAKIRASQGHSIAVEIEFEEKNPPEILYHGTAEKNIKIIQEKGLLKMRRHHVHLSSDIETALKVGKRYGKPFVFKVKAAEMAAKDYKFHVSANGVWLTEKVPPQFLEIQ
ncbi:MAG TPA: RNA 2'-phosphotransferase [Pyrinomonadaceae bacterium]|nr:RNA 2'-phosphotransferase [Pyrinomonadaceae bacterium]